MTPTDLAGPAHPPTGPASTNDHERPTEVAAFTGYGCSGWAPCPECRPREAS